MIKYNSVILEISLFPINSGARDQKEVLQSMKKYELALVLNAKLEDDARSAKLEKIKEMIAHFGGTITNVDDWGKKKLAYEIQKMSEGFYYFIQFDAAATTPAELEERLRIEENVIRYLCVRQDEE